MIIYPDYPDIIELSPCKLPVNLVNEPNLWDMLWWKFMVWSVWSMQNFRILEGWYPIPMKSRRPILACKVDKPIAELWGFTDTWACWFQTQVIFQTELLDLFLYFLSQFSVDWIKGTATENHFAALWMTRGLPSWQQRVASCSWTNMFQSLGINRIKHVLHSPQI